MGTGAEDARIVEIAAVFGDVARALAAHDDLRSILQRIVDLAVANLEACEFAAISLVESRQVRSPASSNDVPKLVDAIQTEVNEGPCLDAIREHEVVVTGDLAAEERWPRFSHRAHEESGVRSILGVRLFVQEDTMGALNLYSTEADAFDETDVALASVFAAHAAVAMQSAQREEDLERKADSRDIIGRAKGMLMARSDIDSDEAFELLRRASQRMNIKVVKLAEDIVHGRTGDS